MRLVLTSSLLFTYRSFVLGSSHVGDDVSDETLTAKRTASQDLGRRMRRMSVERHPAGSEPEDAIPSLLSSAVPLPDARYTTPPRARRVATMQGSPPEGTLVNLDSASSSPVARGTPHPTTPPRARRVVPTALENTPDRPSLYGKYEASADVAPMISQVPEKLKQTRVGYIYSDAFLSSLDSKTRRLALLQISDDIDNYQSAPQLDYSFEILGDSILPSGRSPIIRVANVITNRIETTIIEVYGMPDKVIKYQSNCQSLLGSVKSPLHPILREFWISKYVDEESSKLSAPIQISPRVFFVSPPTSLSMRRTSKTDFGMDQAIREQCVRAGATVRYMIMERTGSNMEDFMSLHNETSNRIEFRLGMKILHQLIFRLKILHSIGIIHGDVHMGNVVRALGGARDQFLLIDYGMASFYDPSKPLSEERGWEDDVLVGTSILTHWQMRGYAKSFRDDILRAMMTVGRIMNGPEYIGILQGAESSPEGLAQLADFFARGDLFATPVANGYNPLNDVIHLTNEIRSEIFEKLKNIRKHAQGISAVNAKPDYDFLLTQIDGIQTLLE